MTAQDLDRLRSKHSKIPPYTCPLVDAALKELAALRNDISGAHSAADTIETLTRDTDATEKIEDANSRADELLVDLRQLAQGKNVEEAFEEVRSANANLRSCADEREDALDEAAAMLANLEDDRDQWKERAEEAETTVQALEASVASYEETLRILREREKPPRWIQVVGGFLRRLVFA